MNIPPFKCISYSPKSTPIGTIFFITSFKTKAWHYIVPIKQLTDHGFTVVTYDYNWKTLVDTYPKVWVGFCEAIKVDITEKINEAKGMKTNATFGIIGVSVGAAIALYSVKRIRQLKKVMLVTMYGSMSKHIWEHPILLGMRTRCVNENLDIKKTAKLLGYFEPTNHLELLKDKKILMFVNENDPVIPYTNTAILVEESIRHNLDFTVRYVPARRHSFTILKVFINSKTWAPFFKSQD